MLFSYYISPVRKIISLFLFIVLVANMFGYFISFTAQRYKIRAELQQSVKEDKAHSTAQFAFSGQEYARLAKLQNATEFTLNGKLYDVLKKELKEGRIVLTVYYDHRESGLMGEFISFISEQTQPEKSKQTLPLFSLLEFVFSPAEWKSYNNCSTLNIPSYSSNLLSLSLDSYSPPPDRIFS